MTLGQQQGYSWPPRGLTFTLTTATAGTSNTWSTWVQTQAVTASASTWTGWTAGAGQVGTLGAQLGAGQGGSGINPAFFQQAARQTAEEVAAQLQRNADAAVEREAALQRSIELLVSCLDAVQRKSFEKHGRFRVVTKSGVVYELNRHEHVNVYKLDGKTKVAKLCIQPAEDVPVGDKLLAQKLRLEHDEAEFNQIANHTRIAA